MNFAEAERRYEELRQQHTAGALSEEAFDAALREIMVQDGQGRWWAKARQSGEWNYYDQASNTWVTAQPPTSSPPPAPPPPPAVGYNAPVANPTPYVNPSATAAGVVGGVPEVTPTLTIIFYVASFFVPLVGIILFFLYRSKPHPSDRKVANTALILGVVSLLLSCMCTFMSMANTGYY
jgi:hypothetical protein